MVLEGTIQCGEDGAHQEKQRQYGSTSPKQEGKRLTFFLTIQKKPQEEVNQNKADIQDGQE
jgi:hypothetical protein